MAFFAYILQSEKSGRYYVGHAEDAQERLIEHNTGRVVSTRGKGPWRIVRVEEFASCAEAARRERQIKGMKSHKWIAQLVGASR